MEDNFAFIIHPIDPQRDVARKFPTLGKLPRWLIEFLSVFFPPVYISQITGIESAHNGRSLHGWFVACPLTPSMMMRLPTAVSYHKITQTGRLAERLGARILGLGAFTSVVGDGGITIAQRLNIPVTNGDSYTVATAVRAIEQAAAIMEIPLPQATAAVVGATGAIGSVCAHMLAPQVKQMILIGRNQEKLQKVAQTLPTSHVTLATDKLEPLEAQWLFETLVITPQNMSHAYLEAGLHQAGFVIDQIDQVDSEWREHWEEDGTCLTSQQLLRLARLRRNRDALIAQVGELDYLVELADCHWGVYQMLGKLCPTVYVATKCV